MAGASNETGTEAATQREPTLPVEGAGDNLVLKSSYCKPLGAVLNIRFSFPVMLRELCKSTQCNANTNLHNAHEFLVMHIYWSQALTGRSN